MNEYYLLLSQNESILFLIVWFLLIAGNIFLILKRNEDKLIIRSTPNIAIVNNDRDLTKKDYSISFARMVAMLLIITCHLMQRDNITTVLKNGNKIEWAYWFNVGVQMFLFLSGYLYGKKRNIEPASHLKKTFSKILTDYYLLLVILSIINAFVPRLHITTNELLSFLTVTSSVPGLGHLWFVSTILFCYLLIPLVLPIISEAEKQYNERGLFLFCVLFLI